MTRELLTHSKRQAFQNCPRYFYHRHEQHLELIARKPGRRRGAIFGEALQAARDYAEGLHPERHDALDAALFVIDHEYALLVERGEIRDQDDHDSLEVEQAKLRVLVPAYIDRYGLVGRREVEFYLPLVNPETGRRSLTFDLAGKIDGMVVVGDRRARVIEDKLVGQLQKSMIDRLPLDAQSSEYVDALITKGWSAEVAYRHTRYPGVNPKPPKEYVTKADYPGETIEEFETRLAADVLERRDWYFDQQILSFPVEHLEDYRAGRWSVGKAIMRARLDARHHGWTHGFPKNPSRCWEYGGCEFLAICTGQEGALDRYRVVPDNPELSEAEDEVAVR